MSEAEKKMSGTEAWVNHHHERGRVMAEEDFAILHRRWLFNANQGEQMEKRAWLRTMAALIGAEEAS